MELPCSEEYDPDDDFEFDESEVDYIMGIAPCGYRYSGMYFVGDKADFLKAIKRIRADHAREHPECREVILPKTDSNR